MSQSLRTLVADRGDAAVRLDLVLRRHLADLAAATRTRVQTWIAGGQVTVNGAPVRRAAARMAPGDVVAVVLPDSPPRRAMAAEDLPLEILYEDDHLLALNKPAGLVVHPTYRHPTGTIMNALLGHARAWPVGCRPSIVGRLDKMTTGIVLVAKSAAVHAALQRATGRTPDRRGQAFAPALADAPGGVWRGPPEPRGHDGGGPAKDYLAVVYGRVTERHGEIDLRLRLEGRDRRRVAASATAGARSVTAFERLARVAAPRAGLALVRCRLLTGRRHQIRVHLAARGWPIVGDPAYGEPRWSTIDDPMLAAALRAFPRQSLHAWRLAVTHPITGERLQLEAPVPRDLADLIALAGF
jgi:23S rRNA pseudouridine1911/1915/1917 synthase